MVSNPRWRQKTTGAKRPTPDFDLRVMSVQRGHREKCLLTSREWCQGVSGGLSSVRHQSPERHRRIGAREPATLRGHCRIMRDKISRPSSPFPQPIARPSTLEGGQTLVDLDGFKQITTSSLAGDQFTMRLLKNRPIFQYRALNALAPRRHPGHHPPIEPWGMRELSTSRIRRRTPPGRAFGR